VRYLIGIDEAGRGPLAGPVAVGAVMVPPGFDWRSVRGVRDSKQLSYKQREDMYATIKQLESAQELSYAVSFSSAEVIDKCGIGYAIRRALYRSTMRLRASPKRCSVLLDGGLVAPHCFSMQKTIIRGDETEPIISLASIVAKVLRDRLMVRLGDEYPEYGFEVHKGYGTLAHRRAVRVHGLSPLHRTTFCTRLQGS